VNSVSYIVGGLVALGLLVYLFIALLRPERF
jgi:K+-transporting ATPase KdpF subunit